jgi:3-methyladenine DNA glycosylase AlkD
VASAGDGRPIDRLRAVIRRLNELGDRTRLSGMERYGINVRRALGVAVPELRALARQIGRDHDLAAALWESEIHEARILASMIDDPALVTEAQMEAWVYDLDSWDLCDQVCANLFDRTRFAFRKAVEWSARDDEFVKRAGFALMATAAVHRKDAPDEQFETFLPIIRAEATDDRRYVRKAVSWALRQIGKRSPDLRRKAIETARMIRRLDSRSARWIAGDALRELESAAVRERVADRAAPSRP